MLSMWMSCWMVCCQSDGGERVVRVNDTVISRAEYQDWLYATHGWRFIDDYVALVLLRQEATRCSLPLPGPEETLHALDKDWKDQVDLRHGGDEESFLKELREGGIDQTGYRWRRLGQLEQEILARRIIVATRAPTEADLQAFHAREFAGDQRVHLKVAFFNKLKKVLPGQRATALFLEQVDRETRERAQEFLEAVRADGSAFSKKLQSSTDPLFLERRDNYLHDLRVNDGDLPRYRKDHFGGIMEQVIKDAAPGDWLGPIAAPNGFYVVQVVEKAKAPFDAIEAELVRLVKEQIPSAGEIHALRTRLLQSASIEKFPVR